MRMIAVYAIFGTPYLALLPVIARHTMLVTNAVANGLLQTLSPDAFRGRVMAAFAWVFVGIGPVIGPFLAGAVAREIGAPATIGIGATVTLVYGLWAKYPEIRAL